MPDAALTDSGTPAAMRQWLLNHVVADPGPLAGGGIGPLTSAGAVIGSFDPDGRARYAYPEIAGYYLSWLAWLSASGSAPTQLNQAIAVTTWLQRWIVSGHATRPCAAEVVDWRNRGLFAFDLAMLLRGLAAAKAQKLLADDSDVLSAQVCALLCRMLDNRGELSPVLLLEGTLPQRWSTQSGAYQAKAGAALLLAARTITLPSVLVVAAHQLLRRCASESAQVFHRESPHAALYALEGLSVGRSLGILDCDVETHVINQLQHWREPLSSWLDPDRSAELEVRHDVLAQWLRLAKLHLPEDQLIDRSDRFLRAAIALNGALPFAREPHDRGACTWAAMFCDQALSECSVAAEHIV